MGAARIGMGLQGLSALGFAGGFCPAVWRCLLEEAGRYNGKENRPCTAFLVKEQLGAGIKLDICNAVPMHKELLLDGYIRDDWCVDLFAKIEREVDVASIRHSGTRIWPLIKLSVYQQAFNPDKPFLAFRRERVQRVKIARDATAYEAMEKGAGKTDALFFCLLHEYLSVPGGLYENRYVDPLINTFAGERSFLKFEFEEKGTPGSFTRKFPSVFWKHSESREDIPSTQLDPIENFELVREAVRESFGMELDERLFQQQMETVNAYTDEFANLLGILRPGAVFLTSYYHMIGMSLIKASRRLGIPSVDLQHGAQSMHPFYSPLGLVPEGGWDFYPDFFWVWGENEAENIASGVVPQGRTAHRPVVGGNLWFDAFNKEEALVTSEELRALDRAVAGRERVILTALPRLADGVPEYLLEALAASPAEWLWLFRQHPYHKEREGDVRLMLPPELAEKVESRAANSLPLPVLLKRSTNFVTGCSSSLYEALCAGTHSVLTHLRGAFYFKEFLASGMMDIARSAPELIQALGGSPDRSASLASFRPYLNNRGRAKAALERILCSRGAGGQGNGPAGSVRDAAFPTPAVEAGPWGGPVCVAEAKRNS